MPTLTGMNAPLVAAPGTQPWNTPVQPSGGDGSNTPWWEQSGSSWGTVTPGQEYLPWNYPIGTPPPSLWGQMQNQPKALPPGQTSGGIMWGGTGTPAQTTLPDSLKGSGGGSQTGLLDFFKNLFGQTSQTPAPTSTPATMTPLPTSSSGYSTYDPTLAEYWKQQVQQMMGTPGWYPPSGAPQPVGPEHRTGATSAQPVMAGTTPTTTTQSQTTNPYSGLDANSILSSPYLSTSLMSLLGQSTPFGGSGTVGNQNQDMMYAY